MLFKAKVNEEIFRKLAEDVQEELTKIAHIDHEGYVTGEYTSGYIVVRKSEGKNTVFSFWVPIDEDTLMVVEENRIKT